MDSSRVLVALEEQEKWRERRTRIEARLQDVRRRSKLVRRELEEARQRLAKLGDIHGPPVNPSPPRDMFVGGVENVR